MTQQPPRPRHGAHSYQQQPPPAPVKPHTPFWRSKKGALVLLAVAGFAACSVANSGGSTTPAPAPAAPTQAAAPAGPKTSFGAGTYEVGTDIAPGKYKTPGGLGGSCYWARLKDTSGSFDSIITNGNAEGPTTVTISKSDGAFETQCTWTKAG